MEAAVEAIADRFEFRTDGGDRVLMRVRGSGDPELDLEEAGTMAFRLLLGSRPELQEDVSEELLSGLIAHVAYAVRRGEPLVSP